MLSVDLNEWHTLIPYPTLHFLATSFAPFRVGVGEESLIDENSILVIAFRSLSPFFPVYDKPIRMQHSVYDPANWMIKCDPRQGLYMGNQLMFRGDGRWKRIGSLKNSN